MSYLTIILLALGLAADAFAVSVSCGCSDKHFKVKLPLLLGLYFGFFQMLMPVIGWFAGNLFKDFITGIDHWIALALLVFIGLKMIRETFSKSESSDEMKNLNHKTFFILAVATSIDALAVGITLSLTNYSLIMPVLVIGLTTFILSFIAAYIGKFLGNIVGKYAEFAGGVILIGIGIKIFVEHMYN